MKNISSAHLNSARESLHQFMQQSCTDVTPGKRISVAEVAHIGAQVNTALDLLVGRLSVDEIKITLSQIPDEPIKS